jgi:cytochrome c553
MAEAILNHLGQGRFCAMSAGDQAVGQIHPMALAILSEHGVPTTTLKSKSWEGFFGLAAPRLDFIIIVCDDSHEEMVLPWAQQPIKARDKAAAYHVTLYKRLSTEMANDIAAYLNRLPPTSGAKTGDGVNVELGSAIFREQCTSCHASDAGGDKEGVVPSLRNQHYNYLVNEMHLLADGRLHDADPGLVFYLCAASMKGILLRSPIICRDCTGPAVSIEEY